MFSDVERATLTVGLKKVRKALAEHRAIKVVIAKDCDVFLLESLQELCKNAGVEPEYAETMADLGQACGIDVKASCACVC
ncbi:MAG: ribosomal L7Ae/L30e/S12e/Gadd45 family protein [Clostridia bacterium]|nr:ribosomal L7Ae/L30e/S12e/Gadd45 family protein [Clostridia bacterium]